MKSRILTLLVLVCALGVTWIPAAHADPYEYDDDYDSYGYQYYDDDFDVDVVDVVDFFRDALTPHGEWFRYGDYGWVWRPRGVGRHWRPYADGHWVLTDVGWTWVADEPWGWAPYHYGRWFYDADYGWAWVPGREWAPAWVSWRRGNGWVGWAPLPPWARWHSGGIPTNVYVEPRHYCFVEERYLVEPRVVRYIAPPERIPRIVHVTRNVTNYARSGDRIVARPFRAEDVERSIGRSVKRHRLADVERVVPRRFHAMRRPGDRRGHDVRTGAPTAPNLRDRERIERERTERDHEKLERRKRLDRERAEHGRALGERRDRAEQERLEREHAQRGRRERAEQERAQREQMQRERQERVQRDRAQREQERVQRDQNRLQGEQERARRDQERRAHEQQERAERERLQQERRGRVESERGNVVRIRPEPKREGDRPHRQARPRGSERQGQAEGRGELKHEPQPDAQADEQRRRGLRGKRDARRGDRE